jgi:hypothetical protein
MDTHVKVLGWLWIIIGALGLIGALCAFVSIAGGGLISGEQDAIIATSITAIVIGSLIFVLSVPSIIAGIGLLKYKSWARILAIILGVLNLFAFPIGTALGIYTLWALLNKETTALFESGLEPVEIVEDSSV